MSKKPIKQTRVIVPGYEPLKNKQREYRNTKTGEVISKRQYQKLQSAQTLKLDKPVSLEKAARIRADIVKQKSSDKTGKDEARILGAGANKMARYNALVKDFKRAECKRLGLNPNKKSNLDKIKVRGDNETANKFNSILKALKSKDNSPNGAKAQALLFLNRRQPEWDMPVGESPK